MDLIIVVVVIGVLIGMVVLMFRYARFIHQGPAPDNRNENQGEDETDNRNENQGEDETDNPSNKDNG